MLRTGLTPARSLQLFSLPPLGTATPTFGQSAPAPGVGTAGSSLSFGASSTPAQGFVGVGAFGKQPVCCQHDALSLGSVVIRRTAGCWPWGSRELDGGVEPSRETQAFRKPGAAFCFVLHRFIFMRIGVFPACLRWVPASFRSPGGTPMLLLLTPQSEAQERCLWQQPPDELFLSTLCRVSGPFVFHWRGIQDPGGPTATSGPEAAYPQEVACPRLHPILPQSGPQHC